MRNIGHEIDAAIERQANEHMDQMGQCQAEITEECEECGCQDDCSLYIAHRIQDAEEARAEAVYEERGLR